MGFAIDSDAIAKSQNLSNLQAGRETIRMVDQCIRQGVPFSLETTLSGSLILKQIQQAKEHNFQVRLLYISLDSPDKHLDRIEQRVIEGGHYINSDDVVRRYHRSHENLNKAISIVDEANVYSNGAKFEMAVRIKHGKIIELGVKIPNWANSILNQFEYYSTNSKDKSSRIRTCSVRCQTSTAPMPMCLRR